MQSFDPSLLSKLYRPAKDSHKGQNGKLLLIGGSQLFHAASLWALEVASRIVDMVFYASVPINNEIVKEAKAEFRNGIVIPRAELESYIEEADCILIGPGLPRPSGEQRGDDGTQELTEKLLRKYPRKRWVIDGGSLQTIDPEVLLDLKQMSILTPHAGEFEQLKLKVQSSKFKVEVQNLEIEEQVSKFAQKYKVVIILKGEKDIVCSPNECIEISGGNAGMTKGGTGDVLAGLVASLYCKNDAFTAAVSGSYINKKVGDKLFEKVGYYFNASDLAREVPKVIKDLLLP